MRLLSSPPGSGKTHRVLEEIRERLRAGAADFRLLVPTFTMAEHLRHQLAREGWVFRPGLVLTFSKFVDQHAQSLAEVPEETLLLQVEAALARLPPGEFRQVAPYAGFQAYIAELIQEFSSAGCDSRRLAALPLNSTLQQSFLRVFLEVEAQLARRGWVLRGERLRHAAEHIEARGLPGMEAVYFDGFFSFTDPELAVIEAISRHAQITVTLPPWDGNRGARDRLLAMGLHEDTSARVPANPQVKIVAAPTLDRETEEIARRILQESSAGRLFREIGVVVRSQDPYVPALRMTFERFGIPARYYFAEVLAGHSVVRCFTALVDAMLGGWEHQATLAALRRNVSDRVEWKVLENLPGRGLDAFPSAAAPLGSLRTLESWKIGFATPRAWAERVQTLRALFRHAASPAPLDRLSTEIARAQAAALVAWETTIDAAAAGLDPQRAIPFEEFWRELKTVLNRTRLRVADRRRNVVHVLDVYEARQWELPVVFVCGLLEKQFPRYYPQDAVFPDDARRRLAEEGVRLRTSADKEQEERFLFELASTRASSTLVLSYPQFNAKGEENLVSFFLDGFPSGREAAVSVRPRPKRPRAPSSKPVIFDEALREHIIGRNRTFSATGLESFLQCPFQYFASRGLRPEGLPARPEDRLDALLQGQIVHEVIAKWRPGADLDRLFEEIFRRACDGNRIPLTCQTETLRLEMLRNLRRFVADLRPAEGYTLHTEAPFELTLPDAVRVRGRIDRYEVDSAGNAVIIDYKYSGGERIRKRIEGHAQEARIQGGLYLLAVERVYGHQPAAMYFWGFRGKITRKGWTDPDDLRRLAVKAERLALESAQHIREGVIKVQPADPGECQYCDFCDGCRVESQERQVAAAGESEWS